ncbi:DegT/DnrJ/EryC1/StrS family aminotransferase [Paenactinomyces guangxiensis]|uniref:DegT/DnrJ/EryC1/StrS family aminotransferase n=1 Tax=Paenactinomyces guangxiensis TaxID=1490290 RepID=A0A7W1WUV0_9BACL|nr:DegT/DnrJ/EryC1/StrS family aminotransferase [Paenactinomyces guangxiensis]MBA4496479.1 DegT/DnrJ/EryC1/StrS family aminotransferase [Paenactinomyces guangxiensis]MBH8593595.1 DegT/DnrJ/EryC1/StrS family aminotransferase [Paenactinomyces guangxiensis]
MELAINGGKPARSKPLPPNYPGAVMMGKEEAEQAAQTILAKSPFRYYGPDVQFAVRRFEEAMAKDLGVPYVLGVSSGTAALIVALKALGIGYGDKVIVPANTFIATAGAVICCNAVPVFCDVDESLNLDPHDLARVTDEEVKAIIAVPILGNPCDMDAVMAFAQERNLYVVEDVAQSCGAKYKGRYLGTIGHIGAFSFQVNKILSAGEGGAVVTGSGEWFERAVRYHDQGLFRDRERYGLNPHEETNAFVGQNYRMSEITGAVLSAQWNKLDVILARMKNNYRTIRDGLTAQIPNIKFRETVDEAGDIGSNLGMILPSGEIAGKFVKALQAENIGVSLLYGGKPIYMVPQILHQRTSDAGGFPFNYPFKRPVVYSEHMCPRATDLMARTVYLPVSPLLTEQDIHEMIEGVSKVYRGLGI